MSKILLFLLASLNMVLAYAQYDPNQLPNTYRSKDNPYYWKNKKPSSDYWQQDVHYSMKAFIDDTNNIIKCTDYELVYWNNSPDDLKELFFHVYQNSFQPSSHMHDLYVNNEKKVRFSDQEKKGLNTKIHYIRVNGEKVDTVHDFSVIKVVLNSPLKAGDSAVIQMQFDTYMDRGNLRSRMAQYETFGKKHFNAVHWYPAISVYDRKFGWNTEQHMDKEFYNNFGTYDLELTFPQEYIVEATGNLLNREEVLPDSLFQKLQLSNFKDKPFNSKPSTIISREEGKTKTWKYHAENIHNVVFTADPHYRIEELEWKGIKIIALAQEQHAAKWQESANFTKEVIKTYDRDFTAYIWPKIIVADANDGMEYPMITLDGGSYPSHQGLLAHEVGHMWFYGMVGSNETYRAFMDEGFTQYLTVWSLERITGKSGTRKHAKNPWINKKLDTLTYKFRRWYYGYIKYVHKGYDYPLNTHSSGFRGAVRHGGGYGLVYYKTAVMLDNLRYVLGDELFLKAMQYYVKTWKCAHPYPNDFRQAIIDYTKTDLNWFFDQWLETTKHINYAIEKVKKVGGKNEYNIKFRRKGQMQMPLDFQIKDKNEKTYHFHIPTTWFTKKTTAKVLPKWYGWDNKLHPTHEVIVQLDAPLKTVEIDPQHILADIDLRDNKWPHNIKLSFDNHVKKYADWKQTHLNIRPDLWYNQYDGLQVGIHANSNYMKQLHHYSYSLFYNSRIGQSTIPTDLKSSSQRLAFSIDTRTSLYKIWDQLYLTLNADINAGLTRSKYGIEKIFRRQDPRQTEYTKFFSSLNFMKRQKEAHAQYLLYPELWTISQTNNWIDVGVEHFYNYRYGSGKIRLLNRSSNGQLNYAYQELEVINTNKIKKFILKTRLFGRYGQRNTPIESALFSAGANPEQLYSNKYTRARAFVPNEWTSFGNRTNHFQQGGGLNLRGFAGVNTIGQAIGQSGIAYNIELEFDQFFKIKSRKLAHYLTFQSYIFSDIGALSYVNTSNNKERIDNIKYDAGIGSAMTIKFGPHLDIKPITIRLDIPLVVNNWKSEVQQAFDFRYVLGFNRAF